MSYYGSGRGDYYKGDYYGYRAGGIFGTIGGLFKKAVGVLSALPTPLQPLARVASSVLNPRQGTAIAPAAPGTGVMRLPQLPAPVLTAGQVGPFMGQTGGLIQVQAYTPTG